MTDPLEPPPWRQIPVDVQDRIMQSTLEEPVVRRRPVLAPLVASLAALAIGAVFTIQATGGGGAGPPADANPGLDRCAAAARDSGQLADRSEWEQVFESRFLDFKVIAARAAAKPVFCELTPTTATVSTAEPRYVPGTGAGLVMTTPLGTIGGVADPAWHQVWIRHGDSSQPTTMVDGMFIGGFWSGEPIEVASTERSSQWITLPLLEGPPVTVVDARQGPAPDRSSGRGRILGECIKAAGSPRAVIDPDSWEPGAMVQDGATTNIITRNAYGYSSCTYSTENSYGVFGSIAGRGYYQADKAADRGPMPRTFPITSDPKSGRIFFGGVVPPDTRRVQVVSNDVTVEADVANSTFAALLPPGSSKRTLRLYDGTGKLTYEGS